MNWLKSMLGLGAPNPVDTQPALPQGPLGLAAGRTLSLDSSLKFSFADGIELPLPDATQNIWSAGLIDLGQANWLNRFYLDDNDTWLQVHTSGERDGPPESVILFSYLSYVTINGEAELRRLAGEQSPIGMPTYLHNGKTFLREWGTEEGQTELVQFFEAVTSPKESYRIRHHAMLYSRDTGLPNRREFLLFSVEAEPDGSTSLSTSIGVTLFSTDFSLV